MTEFLYGLAIGAGLILICEIIYLEIRLRHVEDEVSTLRLQKSYDDIRARTSTLTDAELNALNAKYIGGPKPGAKQP